MIFNRAGPHDPLIDCVKIIRPPELDKIGKPIFREILDPIFGLDFRGEGVENLHTTFSKDEPSNFLKIKTDFN